MKHTYKVLPLEFWMQHCDAEEILEMEYYDITLIHPMFNRDGYYYDRHKKFCWFEVDGRAYHNKDLAGSFCYRINNGQEEYILPAGVAGKVRLFYTPHGTTQLKKHYRHGCVSTMTP